MDVSADPARSTPPPSPTRAATTAPLPSHRPLPRRQLRVLGASAGIVAALVALGAAEAVAATSRTFQSPVLDVGDRVVDAVPRSVKDLAIDWFGTNDKVALLVGIATILAACAVVAGVVSFSRHLPVALTGIATFGVLGAVASQTTRREAPLVAVLPSVIGAVAGVGALWTLRVLGTRRPPNIGDAECTDTDADPPAGNTGGTGATGVTGAVPVERIRSAPTIAELVPNDRRRFLAGAAAMAAGALVVGTAARSARSRFDVGSERSRIAVPGARQPLPPAPADVSAAVPGVSPFFTANRDFYRIDTALSVPQVAVDSWRLRVTGMVDDPFELSYAELLDLPLVEADITLTCVSNEVGGRLVGTARWLGVRLDDLLRDAGIAAGADQVVGRSVDGYTCGFPVAALDGRDALVAIGMNGELLPLEHGFPARLIVPGLYGYVSATKWLTEIELTRFDRFDQYWVERGWVDDAPIKVQSRIDTPKGLATVDPGIVAIGGVAWAQTRGIERVEVQIDDGEWFDTTLAAELNDVTWRQWSFAWEATSGRHTVRVRATERNGAIQTPDRSEPFPSGATGQHQIVVIVR